MPEVPGEILNAEVSAALGLPPFSPDEQDYREKERGGLGGARRGLRPRWLEEEAGEAGGPVLSLSAGDGDGSWVGEGGAVAGAPAVGSSGGGKGPFDLSVLCTAVSDLNHLMKSTYPVDSRLVDALMWNVDVRGAVVKVIFQIGSGACMHVHDGRDRLLRLRSMALRVALLFFFTSQGLTVSLLFGLVPAVRFFRPTNSRKGSVYTCFFFREHPTRTDPSYSLEQIMSWVDFTSG